MQIFQMLYVLIKNKQYNTNICVILFLVDIRIHRFTLLYQTFFQFSEVLFADNAWFSNN